MGNYGGVYFCGPFRLVGYSHFCTISSLVLYCFTSANSFSSSSFATRRSFNDSARSLLYDVVHATLYVRRTSVSMGTPPCSPSDMGNINLSGVGLAFLRYLVIAEQLFLAFLHAVRFTECTVSPKFLGVFADAVSGDPSLGSAPVL